MPISTPGDVCQVIEDCALKVGHAGQCDALTGDVVYATTPQRLVTIDLDDEETLEQIAYAYRKYEGGRDAYAVELALLDVFRPPTPMPEGMFAVVRDAEGWEYCQVGPDQWLSLNNPDGRGYFQNLTQPVEVLFIGTSPMLRTSVPSDRCHATLVARGRTVRCELEADHDGWAHSGADHHIWCGCDAPIDEHAAGECRGTIRWGCPLSKEYQVPTTFCPDCHPVAGREPIVHAEHDWSIPGGGAAFCPGRKFVS